MSMAEGTPTPQGHTDPEAETQRSRRRVGGARWQRLLPDRPAAVDALATVLLTGCALVGLRTTFWGWTWLVIGGAGVLLGVLLTHVGMRLRWPAVLIAALVVAAHFVLGGPIASRDDLVGGVLPTGATFDDLVRTPVDGWKQLLTTVPPLDSSGPLMLVPFMIGLFGAALCYGIARAWRSAGAALVVPAGLLALSIALGTIVPAALLVQGVGFTVVAVVWTALRARRHRPPLQNGAGRNTRFVTAVSLLVVAGLAGWLIGPVLPGHAEGARSVWRSQVEPPFDVSQFPSPLAGYRKYTEPNKSELYDRTLLTVKGLPEGSALRFATLDSYDGYVWGAGQRTGAGEPVDPTEGFRRVGSHIATVGSGPEVSVSVSVPADGYDNVWLPTSGQVTGVEFTGPDADQHADGLRFNTATDTAVLPSGLGPGDSYRMTLRPRSLPTSLPETVATRSGSEVDTGSLTFLDDALDKYGGDDPSAWGQLRSVARSMRDEGAYTDGDPTSYERSYLPGHSIGRIERFLAATQLAGNDEQYAATLALVANRLDIPARVVLGAIPRGGVVKGKDVHAWVEVQQEDGTWLTIPPSAFVPKHNKKPKQQQQRSEEKRVGALVPPPASNNPPSVLQGPDQAQNETQVKKRHHDDEDRGFDTWSPWLKFLVLGVGLPLLVLLLLYGGVLAWKARRRHVRRTRGSAPARLSAGWNELVDSARELRIPVTQRATRHEQAQELEAAWNQAPVLAGSADRFVFGPVDPEQEQVAGYWDEVLSARSGLRKRAGWWRRRRADLTLRPGRWQRRHEDKAARGARGDAGTGRPESESGAAGRTSAPPPDPAPRQDTADEDTVRVSR